MKRVNSILLATLPLAVSMSTPAGAASFVKYVFSGTVSGTRIAQPANSIGIVEAVSGTASFEYFLPLGAISQGGANVTYSATSGYFLGAAGQWTASGSVVSFFERGFGNAGVSNYLSASACLPNTGASLTAYSGAVDGSCGSAMIHDTERGMTLNLQGTIDSFTAQVAEGNAPTMGLNSYSVSIAAVPEPATWSMLFLGFAFVGGILRRRVRLQDDLQRI